MTAEQLQPGRLSIIELQSGIEHDSLEEAPDEPLGIQLVGIRPADLRAISTRFIIDLEDLQDLQDMDERPRLQVEDRFTMLVLRVPVDLTDEHREYSTAPIGLFTNGRDVLVLQDREIPLRKKRLLRRLKMSATPSEMIYSLLQIVIASFEYSLDMIEATINEVQKNIMSELYPTQLNRFFQLSRDAVFMEAALSSNMNALWRLQRTPNTGQVVLDENRLSELEVDLQQQMELSAIYRELIDNAMNAYDSIVSHNLNRVIKTLTSISLLVSLPTLIASLYGMNVRLPLEDNPYAFIILIALSLSITVPLLVYLRIKNLV
ncbi:MAG: magnesium transporter CorA family protein [Candidatus Thorarchaeota archaeon]